MKEPSKPVLKVINGGRKHLENAVMKQMAEGSLSKELLERLKPKGNLVLAYSRPDTSIEKSDELLNFEDLNF